MGLQYECAHLSHLGRMSACSFGQSWRLAVHMLLRADHEIETGAVAGAPSPFRASRGMCGGCTVFSVLACVCSAERDREHETERRERSCMAHTRGGRCTRTEPR